jgi:hypothetical protein
MPVLRCAVTRIREEDERIIQIALSRGETGSADNEGLPG